MQQQTLKSPEQKASRTKKQISQISSDQGQQERFNLKELEKSIYLEDKGKFYIGGELVTEQMRGILRDQAKNFQTSNLFEIIDATIINEASNLFLQAGNMEHLQYAKALHYWNNILKKMLNALSK